MTANRTALDEVALRRLAEMAARMGEFYEPECVPSWFFVEQHHLGGKRPIDMLQTDDGWRELQANVGALCDGAFV